MIQQGGRLQFSETILGILISATYIGFLASGAVLRRLLPRASFIRTFAVCAAMVSSLTLLMPILPSEMGWIIIRFLYGAFFCATVVICDSWLNTNATRENRSKLLGMFMTVNYIFFGAGQYILILGEKEPVHAFMLSAICLALCMVPICLTRLPEPQPPQQDAGEMRWRDAYAVAPVAFLGQFAFGMYTGATFLLIAYLEGLGVSSERQSTLAAMFFGFGFLMQLPIGWLADKARDRRDIILAVSVVSAICAGFLGLGDFLPYAVLAGLIVLLGTVSCTLFALNIAYGQDFVEKEKTALYAGMLMRVYALGGLLGPPVAGFLMGAISPNMLFWFSSGILITITLITATTRLMPKYRPAHTEQFRPASPLTAAASLSEDTIYTETDIGPELPGAEAEEPLAADSDADVPTEDADTPTPLEGEDADASKDIGPDLPDVPDSSEPEEAIPDIGPELPDSSEVKAG